VSDAHTRTSGVADMDKKFSITIAQWKYKLVLPDAGS